MVVPRTRWHQSTAASASRTASPRRCIAPAGTSGSTVGVGGDAVTSRSRAAAMSSRLQPPASRFGAAVDDWNMADAAVTVRPWLPSSWSAAGRRPSRRAAHGSPSTRNGPTLPRARNITCQLHLEAVGAHELGGEVDGGRLEQHVLGPDVQRGIGRGQLDRELGQRPVAVVAAKRAEHLPQRRQVGGVHDLELVSGIFSSPSAPSPILTPWPSVKAMTRAGFVGVDDLRRL